MDMDSFVLEATEEKYKNLQALLVQYQTEINELKSGEKMSKKEIEKEIQLENKIKDLEDSILNFEVQNSYIL